MRNIWTVALAAGLNVMAFATAAAAEDRELLTIMVVVVNEAKVPKDTLHAAQILAARIYARLNIHIVWQDSKAPPSTAATHATLRLAVIIIPESKHGHGPDTMGFAFNGGTLAYVFYGRIDDFSQRRSLSMASALGHTLAHETGHLLLPNRPHAASGIMRRSWGRDPDLMILRNWGLGLAFTSEEALIVRRNASGTRE